MYKLDGCKPGQADLDPKKESHPQETRSAKLCGGAPLPAGEVVCKRCEIGPARHCSPFCPNLEHGVITPYMHSSVHG